MTTAPGVDVMVLKKFSPINWRKKIRHFLPEVLPFYSKNYLNIGFRNRQG
jgi:hypothetical protein